jgi:DNA polymerase III subunit gamma/tau
MDFDATLLSQARVWKKKWLTDKVDIIPFPNQKLREKVSPKTVENKPSVGTSYSISTPAPPKIVSQPVGSLKTSNISIKEILNPPKSEQIHAGNDGVPIKETKPLELESLLMYWKQYAHQLQQQDKTNLFSILIKRNPKIVNDNSIIFEVDNDLVKDMLSAELQSLVPFLKQNLNNGLLQISLSVPNQENEVKNPYSPTEKFKVFADKNPNIAMLQRMFNLDVDY